MVAGRCARRHAFKRFCCEVCRAFPILRLDVWSCTMAKFISLSLLLLTVALVEFATCQESPNCSRLEVPYSGLPFSGELHAWTARLMVNLCTVHNLGRTLNRNDWVCKSVPSQLHHGSMMACKLTFGSKHLAISMAFIVGMAWSPTLLKL